MISFLECESTGNPSVGSFTESFGSSGEGLRRSAQEFRGISGQAASDVMQGTERSQVGYAESVTDSSAISTA